MTNALHRETKQVMFNLSDTSRLDPSEWIVGFDMEPLAGLSMRHWKIEGDSVVPMTPVEQELVNSQLQPLCIANASLLQAASKPENIQLQDDWMSLGKLTLLPKTEDTTLAAIDIFAFTAGSDARARLIKGEANIVEVELFDTCDTWQNMRFFFPYNASKGSKNTFRIEALSFASVALIQDVSISLFQEPA